MTAALVGGQVVTVAEIDERERILRSGNRASALPRPGTSEGRQLRRWLTQLVTAERAVALETHDAERIPGIDEVLPDMAARPLIAAHLTAAARRRAFRCWLDARCAELVVLSPGYEHPGDPRQPDNTHRH